MDPAGPAALQIARSISREDMAKLPIRRYEGRVCLVATPEDLEEARADLEQESIAGFDTETRPAFRKGESHLPALVQVATARAVYLFQLRRAEVRNLAGILLGLRIPKGTKTSNWAAPQLSAAQIAYAATDAWACRELHLRFQSLGLLRPPVAPGHAL